ncbi:IS481 family transposase [Fodinibius halophilus]|uniref:IS481 family transposase n=1 Tax=Fodinibius halophilus TaxID=1736908 RepID=A0A6M1TBZ1_9BACT|nr:IS481 family transposase [Fodinibius halophilus]NGP88444.1 IS481 family transposase [Fodinibius halophilus]
MPWKTEETKMELKAEFVQMADQPQTNMSKLCRRFGISCPTGYKWLRRYQQDGLEGLSERSRRPDNNQNKTPDHIEELVVEARRRDPGWGGRKLRCHLCNQARAGTIEAAPEQIPAASTITSILDRHDMLAEPSDPSRRGSWQRFERGAPNELWQLDFKGEFRLANQQYCYPLTLVDDHSRFSLAVAGCPNQQRSTVQELLITVFRRYGLPWAMLCDNGPPWGAGLGWRDWGPFYTGLAVWLMRLGIDVIYSRPNHPQGKGKNERFNRTRGDELLAHRQFADHSEAHARMADWRTRYNTVRPHQHLDMNPPATRYESSDRAFPEHLPPVAYASGATTRKVTTNGRIRFRGQRFTVGKAFSGHRLALRASSESHTYDVYFCNQQIRTINLNKNAN